MANLRGKLDDVFGGIDDKMHQFTGHAQQDKNGDGEGEDSEDEDEGYSADADDDL